jgi:hypothetical protein
MRRLRAIVLAGCVVTACSAVAQDNDSVSTAPAPCIPPLKRHQIHIIDKERPYSGVRISTCRKSLPDGTVYKATRKMWEWRDSEGRTRYETLDGVPGHSKWHDVHVYDPVEHVEWHWDTADKTAIGLRYKAAVDSVTPPINRSVQPDGNLDPPLIAHLHQPAGSYFPQEILAPTNINGVWSEGVRSTTLETPGMGNNHSNAPELVVDEFWISTELEEEVRYRCDDPDLGTTSVDLVEIDQREPDRSLFRPPADYALLDATRNLPEDMRGRPFVVPAKK